MQIDPASGRAVRTLAAAGSIGGLTANAVLQSIANKRRRLTYGHAYGPDMV